MTENLNFKNKLTQVLYNETSARHLSSAKINSIILPNKECRTRVISFLPKSINTTFILYYRDETVYLSRLHLYIANYSNSPITRLRNFNDKEHITIFIGVKRTVA